MTRAVVLLLGLVSLGDALQIPMGERTYQLVWKGAKGPQETLPLSSSFLQQVSTAANDDTTKSQIIEITDPNSAAAEAERRHRERVEAKRVKAEARAEKKQALAAEKAKMQAQRGTKHARGTTPKTAWDTGFSAEEVAELMAKGDRNYRTCWCGKLDGWKAGDVYACSSVEDTSVDYGTLTVAQNERWTANTIFGPPTCNADAAGNAGLGEDFILYGHHGTQEGGGIDLDTCGWAAEDRDDEKSFAVVDAVSTNECGVRCIMEEECIGFQFKDKKCLMMSIWKVMKNNMGRNSGMGIGQALDELSKDEACQKTPGLRVEIRKKCAKCRCSDVKLHQDHYCWIKDCDECPAYKPSRPARRMLTEKQLISRQKKRKEKKAASWEKQQSMKDQNKKNLAKTNADKRDAAYQKAKYDALQTTEARQFKRQTDRVKKAEAAKKERSDAKSDEYKNRYDANMDVVEARRKAKMDDKNAARADRLADKNEKAESMALEKKKLAGMDAMARSARLTAKTALMDARAASSRRRGGTATPTQSIKLEFLLAKPAGTTGLSTEGCTEDAESTGTYACPITSASCALAASILMQAIDSPDPMGGEPGARRETSGSDRTISRTEELSAKMKTLGYESQCSLITSGYCVDSNSNNGCAGFAQQFETYEGSTTQAIILEVSGVSKTHQVGLMRAGLRFFFRNVADGLMELPEKFKDALGGATPMKEMYQFGDDVVTLTNPRVYSEDMTDKLAMALDHTSDGFQKKWGPKKTPKPTPAPPTPRPTPEPTGAPRATPRPTPDLCTSTFGQASPSKLLSGGDFGLIVLWDMTTCSEEKFFSDMGSSSIHLIEGLEGGYALTMDAKNHVVVWDVEESTYTQTKMLASTYTSGGGTGHPYSWSVSDGSAYIGMDTGAADTVTWSSDGSMSYTAGGLFLAGFLGGSAHPEVRGLYVNADGSFVAVSGDGNLVYSTGTSSTSVTPIGAGMLAMSYALSCDLTVNNCWVGGQAYGSDTKGAICAMKVGDDDSWGSNTHSCTTYNSVIRAVEMNYDKDYLVGASADASGTVRIHALQDDDHTSNTVYKSKAVHSKAVVGMEVQFTKQIIATAGQDLKVMLWAYDKGVARELGEHKGQFVRCLSFLPDDARRRRQMDDEKDKKMAALPAPAAK